MTDLSEALAHAVSWAREAGEIQLRDFRSKNFSIATKLNESDIVTSVDKASERIIIDNIRRTYPDHSILSEESGESDGTASPYRWVIDPLDGTTNYSAGLPAFAVSIALEKDGEAVAGVVYAPYLDELFCAVKGGGATLNSAPIRVSDKSRMDRAVMSTGFPVDKDVNPDNNIDNLARVLPLIRGLRRLGSAAIDICYVAAGILDGYWELNLHRWDVSAALLIASEAGARHGFFRHDRNVSVAVATPGIMPQLLPLLSRGEPSIAAGLCSADDIRSLADAVCEPYVILNVDTRAETTLSPEAFTKMVSEMERTGAVMLYSDYTADGEPHPCIDWQPGSIRDDFCFGPLVLLRAEAFKKAAAEVPDDYLYAGWYDTRLRLSRMGPVVHMNEYMYTASNTDRRSAESRQFDYVNPRNGAVQAEMERTSMDHLKQTGAYLPPGLYEPVDTDGDFPVEASVVIPVRDRVGTIADAVRSALGQQTDFPFNVIVVDNHSTDGTGRVLSEISSDDPRLIVITPESAGHGIGGCWNIAIGHPQCGRYSVQLDSDDLYGSGHTLQRIVDCFRKENCAMVVGAYTLTDFNLNTLSPGLIAHREWTPDNGRNNALRVNGFGAPRAYATAIARRMPMPDVSYGEDYAMCLQLSRLYPVGRIYESLYLCRRWGSNSDSCLSIDQQNANNFYKDTVRTREIEARRALLDRRNAD